MADTVADDLTAHLAKARQSKAEGTEALKRREYRSAAASYQQALSHTEHAAPSPEAQLLQVQCGLNLALCALKAAACSMLSPSGALKEWRQCELHCRRVLELDPNSAKARYRLACALEELGVHWEASDQAGIAVDIDKAAAGPDDPGIHSLKKQLFSNWAQRLSRVRILTLLPSHIASPIRLEAFRRCLASMAAQVSKTGLMMWHVV